MANYTPEELAFFKMINDNPTQWGEHVASQQPVPIVPPTGQVTTQVQPEATNIALPGSNPFAQGDPAMWAELKKMREQGITQEMLAGLAQPTSGYTPPDAWNNTDSTNYAIYTANDPNYASNISALNNAARSGTDINSVWENLNALDLQQGQDMFAPNVEQMRMDYLADYYNQNSIPFFSPIEGRPGRATLDVPDGMSKSQWKAFVDHLAQNEPNLYGEGAGYNTRGRDENGNVIIDYQKREDGNLFTALVQGVIAAGTGVGVGAAYGAAAGGAAAGGVGAATRGGNIAEGALTGGITGGVGGALGQNFAAAGPAVEAGEQTLNWEDILNNVIRGGIENNGDIGNSPVSRPDANGPMIGNTQTNSRPGWHWEDNPANPGTKIAVKDAPEMGGGGGGNESSGGTSGNAGGNTDEAGGNTEHSWVYQGGGVFKDSDTGATYEDPDYDASNDPYTVGGEYSRGDDAVDDDTGEPEPAPPTDNLPAPYYWDFVDGEWALKQGNAPDGTDTGTDTENTGGDGGGTGDTDTGGTVTVPTTGTGGTGGGSGGGNGPNNGPGDGPGDGKDSEEPGSEELINMLLGLSGGRGVIPVESDWEPADIVPYDFASIFRDAEQEARFLRPFDSKELAARHSKILHAMQNGGKLSESDRAYVTSLVGDR